MKKIWKMVDVETGNSLLSTTPKTDWTLCIICQKQTQDKLLSPASANNAADVNAGYRTFSTNIQGFADIGELPPHLRLCRLDDGQGIEQTLASHEAKWHKSCRNTVNSLKLDRVIKRKRTSEETPYNQSEQKRTRSTIITLHEPKATRCFFCDQESIHADLNEASTFGLDTNVREAALKLDDTKLLAKLSVGDMIAIEAKYHKKCLTSLYNKARAADVARERPDNHRVNVLHSIVFSMLVSFINECKEDDSVATAFKLSDLTKMYREKLSDMGAKDEVIHSTRLKTKLLAHIPDLQVESKGRDVYLAFKKDMGLAIHEACGQNLDSDALCLARAATIVRNEMFSDAEPFCGSFTAGCQENSIPSNLLALMRMIVEGPSIKNKTDSHCNTAALSVAQLLKFNSVKHARPQASSTETRHALSQQTPLPIYVGLMLYTHTRKRNIIDKLFDLGLCISYDRVLSLSSDLASSVCEYYNRTQVVCPPQLSAGVFTTAAVDNIDHNPSSNTATGSFHGTGISLFQHPSTDHTCPMGIINIESSGTLKNRQQLPSWYVNVRPDVCSANDPPVPEMLTSITSDSAIIKTATDEEILWLEAVRRQVFDDCEPDAISWSAHHSKDLPQRPNIKCLTALLPLFPDAAHSVAMIQHSMDIVTKAINFSNPGQIPVLACDQPLYALSKQIQWASPVKYGEDRMVLMLGGLHIEMAALKMIGVWLQGSGWTDVLVDAGITTAGSAESFLNASHVKRTRYAHQVFASSLYILLKKAYDSSQSAQDFESWCEVNSTRSPLFRYWFISLKLELTILTYVRSIRTSDFLAYIEAINALVPWFFALDRTHYARWLTIHMKDMSALSASHPAVAAEFMNGHFTVKKTGRIFSAIAIDHAHEQNNKLVKGEGGALGLMTDEASLRRWMIAGPELARIVKEFESDSRSRKSKFTAHHEDSPCMQKRFKRDTVSLVDSIIEVGNPFDGSCELVSLYTRHIADDAMLKTVGNVESGGKELYNSFIHERLLERTKSIMHVISRNKFALFTTRPVKKTNGKLALAKSDVQLFSRLYIGCQTRSVNLELFFSHENQPFPLSLATNTGNIRSATKSDLMPCFEKLCETGYISPAVTAIVLDGAAVVQMLKPGTARTFSDYSKQVFCKYIITQVKGSLGLRRVDIVWDQYKSNSLKAATRLKRGAGIKKQVKPMVPMPVSWQDFLRVNENKEELFSFLSKEAVEIDEGEIIATLGEDVISSKDQDLSQLSPCSQEEADTRIFLHAKHAAAVGHKSIMIRTVDTDVVVLAVSLYQHIGANELWIAFGTGKKFRYIPAHEIAHALGPETSSALNFFHAFTGCDTVSAFNGRGKKTAWDVWSSFPDVTVAFMELSCHPQHISDEYFILLERFVVLLYDRTSSSTHVDYCRKFLFTKKGRTLENIPPTQAALMQHAKRAAYQGGYVWGQSLIKAPEVPNPADWGWTIDGDIYRPLWTVLPDAAQSCKELVRCSCKMVCSGRCSCVRATLPCTSLCACDGDCLNE